MNTPSFLGPVSRRSSRRLELVHVESGAVLASRVAAGEEARAEKRRFAQRPVDGGEPVAVSPGAWTHTFFATLPTDVAFVGADGTVLKTRRGLRPRRAAAARGAHAVIEGRAGFLTRAEIVVGERVALREAQAPRPAREMAPWQTALGGDQDAVSDPGAEGVWETDAESDPWDVGTLEAPQPPATAQAAGRAGEQPAVPLPPRQEQPPPRVEPAPTAKARPRAVPARGASLDQLLLRQTPIEWFEAVAIAEGICTELLRDAPPGGRGVPEADGIAITPEGEIEMLAGGERDAPSARLARHLHAMSEGAQGLPVQLRLLVLQELSPSPGCASVLEFSTRLALFERPGRANLIRGVYERYLRLPPRDAELRPAVAPATTPVPQPPAWWLRRDLQYAAAAVVAVLLLSTAVVWLWRAASPPPPGAVDQRGPVARAVSAAGESVSQAAAGSARTVSRWLGFEATDRPTAGPAVEAVETPAPPVAATLRRPPARGPRPAAPGSDSSTAVILPPPETWDTTLYSRVDTEVVPPSLVRSRLPSDPPQGVASDTLPEVEVVISPTGEVESVKLVTEQAGVLPSMMLSAIKAWRFRPATRDGEPVRYRLRMRLTNR